jgi:hypothetical protein
MPEIKGKWVVLDDDRTRKRKYLPQIKADLELLEKVLETYDRDKIK